MPKSKMLNVVTYAKVTSQCLFLSAKNTRTTHLEPQQFELVQKNLFLVLVIIDDVVKSIRVGRVAKPALFSDDTAVRGALIE